MKFDLWKSLLCLALFACFDAAGDWVHVTNLNTISILDGGGLVVPAQASPYPSTNLISVPAGLVVSKVLVTLSGFTHSFPSDVSMLLVGPQGQQGILMSEVGGQNQFGVSGLTLLLDDDATTTLPVYSSLTSGVFKPTNGYLALQYPRLPYDFPQPAPVGNSNAVASLSTLWSNDLADRDNTFGVNATQKDLFKGRFQLKEDFTYSLSKSKYITTLGQNIPATLSNQGETPNISSELTQLKLAGTYQFNRASSVIAGYMYQRLKSNDYYYNAYLYGFTPTSMLPTKQRTPNYSVNTVFVAYRYSFR